MLLLPQRKDCDTDEKKQDATDEDNVLLVGDYGS